MSSVGLSFLLVPRLLLSVFTTEPAVIGTGAACLRVAFLMQPFIAITDTLAGALRGAGDTRGPMQVTAGVVWLLRVPLTFLVVRGLGLGLVWVWVVSTLDWVVRAALIWRRFRSGSWAEIQL
jgi:Na+-driven multidrug efflux pump